MPSSIETGDINNKSKRRSKISDHNKKIFIIQALLVDDWIETGDFAWKTEARSKPAKKIGGSTKKNFDLFADQLLKLEEEKILISKEDVSKKRKFKPRIYSLNKENWKTVLFIHDNIPNSQDYILNNDWAFDIIYNQKIEGISDNNVKSDVKHMLKISPTFYQFAMNFPNLRELAELYYEYSILYKLEIINPLKPELNKVILDRKQKFAFHELFLFCVFCDRIKNPDNSSAFTFLREIKNQSAIEEVWDANFSSQIINFLSLRTIFEFEKKEPLKIKKIMDLIDRCDKLISPFQNVENEGMIIDKLSKTFNEIDNILGINNILNEKYFKKK